MSVTPIRRQYLRLKQKYPEAVVFFRLGDFYETFDEDARIASRELDIPPDKIVLWNPDMPQGGLTGQQIRKAVVILWKGYCHVHTFFTLKHVREARRKYKDCKIVVHPECPEEVVLASDASGSTGFIVKHAQEAPKGSTIVIGTEINLVSRLAYEHPDKKIYELARSLCPNMYKINLYNLLYSLENIGNVNLVTIEAQTKKHAKVALERMLSWSVEGLRG